MSTVIEKQKKILMNVIYSKFLQNKFLQLFICSIIKIIIKRKQVSDSNYIIKKRQFPFKNYVKTSITRNTNENNL